MAKIKVRAHPGALSELLNKKGMTQMDAKDKTGVDRKTLLKIERGEEVKLETIQRVATKLQVTEGYFSLPAAAVVADPDEDNPSWTFEPGTIMLRKLDAARLEELLNGAERIKWHLNAAVRDETARKFLEEFETAVENFRGHLVFGDNSLEPLSLRIQLDRLKTADDIAARLERLAEYRLALLGADYLFWEHTYEEGEYEERRWSNEGYRSYNTALLSIEPFGTRSRRARIFAGKLPPTSPQPIGHTVYVNGVELPSVEEL